MKLIKTSLITAVGGILIAAASASAAPIQRDWNGNDSLRARIVQTEHQREEYARELARLQPRQRIVSSPYLTQQQRLVIQRERLLREERLQREREYLRQRELQRRRFGR